MVKQSPLNELRKFSAPPNLDLQEHLAVKNSPSHQLHVQHGEARLWSLTLWRPGLITASGFHGDQQTNPSSHGNITVMCCTFFFFFHSSFYSWLILACRSTQLVNKPAQTRFKYFQVSWHSRKNNYTVTLDHQMNCSRLMRRGPCDGWAWAVTLAGSGWSARRRGTKGHMVRLGLTFSLSSSSGQTQRSSAQQWLTGTTINRKFSWKCHLIFLLIKTFIVSFKHVKHSSLISVCFRKGLNWSQCTY